MDGLLEAVISNVKWVYEGTFNMWPMIDGFTKAVIMNGNEFIDKYLCGLWQMVSLLEKVAAFANDCE
jgi:hypothetical protein